MVPRRRSCGVATNTLVDLIKIAGESPSFNSIVHNLKPPPLCAIRSVLRLWEPHPKAGRSMRQPFRLDSDPSAQARRARRAAWSLASKLLSAGYILNPLLRSQYLYCGKIFSPFRVDTSASGQGTHLSHHTFYHYRFTPPGLLPRSPRPRPADPASHCAS